MQSSNMLMKLATAGTVAAFGFASGGTDTAKAHPAPAAVKIEFAGAQKVYCDWACQSREDNARMMRNVERRRYEKYGVPHGYYRRTPGGYEGAWSGRSYGNYSYGGNFRTGGYGGFGYGGGE